LHQTPDASAKIRGEKAPRLLSDNNVWLRRPLRYSGVMISADDLIASADLALRTLHRGARAGRAMPRGAAPSDVAALNPQERRLSGALMRVNHVGEVCAQALYAAQAMTARTPQLRTQMLAAGREETDHLAWTERRLDELGDRTSLLNPLWYAGAFAIGLAAGRAGDRVSLGFVVETERQVEAHLASHLDRLPAADADSRAVVAQMQADEARHADEALAAGAAAMPAPARWLMRSVARVMTRTAHVI
jgi:ubiquinone biosynthesis monooxygenase Coq7